MESVVKRLKLESRWISATGRKPAKEFLSTTYIRHPLKMSIPEGMPGLRKVVIYQKALGHTVGWAERFTWKTGVGIASYIHEVSGRDEL